jgi:HemY protein
MWRTARFLLTAIILLALAWWIGNLPGTLTAQSGVYTIQTSVPAAIVMIGLLVWLLLVALRVAGGVKRAPGGYFSWRGARRQRLGEIATQRGIVALAAGDAAAAESESGRARRLIGETPLVLLLTAESARLSGKTDVANAAFQKLTAHKDMAFLGHRGLLRHHMASGDHDTADVHAKAADQHYPGSAWLRTKKRDIAIKQADWPAALALTHEPAARAALATAAAGSATDDRQAVDFAKQAVKASPGLAPAVVAYAESLRKRGKLGAARKALINGWKAAPNPLIAQSFIAPFPTAIERAQTAPDLAAANPGHPESEIFLAQTYLEARLTGEAKRHAEAAIAAGLTDNRAADVLAALGEGGGQALVPVSAAKSAWVCNACGAAAEAWAPVCPQCHKAGALAWKVPDGTMLA